MFSLGAVGAMGHVMEPPARCWLVRFTLPVCCKGHGHVMENPIGFCCLSLVGRITIGGFCPWMSDPWVISFRDAFYGGGTAGWVLNRTL